MIDPEWKGFRSAPDGTWCWNGFAIFGHILPRVAIFDVPCHRDGSMVTELGEGQVAAPFTRAVLQVEWLGRGLAFGLPGARIRPTPPQGG